MKIAIRQGEVILQQLMPEQYNTIKSWNLMRWDKAEQALKGKASIDLLDRLAGLGQLPPSVEKMRLDLHGRQDAINRERINPAPVPIVAPPVKASLFDHQKRALNMCLLTFGWAESGGESDG